MRMTTLSARGEPPALLPLLPPSCRPGGSMEPKCEDEAAVPPKGVLCVLCCDASVAVRKAGEEGLSDSRAPASTSVAAAPRRELGVSLPEEVPPAEGLTRGVIARCVALRTVGRAAAPAEALVATCGRLAAASLAPAAAAAAPHSVAGGAAAWSSG